MPGLKDQTTAVHRPATMQTKALASSLGLPDVEHCLEAAMAAGRKEGLENAIRFAVRGMAAADAKNVDVLKVMLLPCPFAMSKLHCLARLRAEVLSAGCWLEGFVIVPPAEHALARLGPLPRSSCGQTHVCCAQAKARLAAAKAKLQQLQGSVANPPFGPHNTASTSLQHQSSTSRRRQGIDSRQDPGCSSSTSLGSHVKSAIPRVTIPRASQTSLKTSGDDAPSQLMKRSHPPSAQQPHMNRHGRLDWDPDGPQAKHPYLSTSQGQGAAGGIAAMAKAATTVQLSMPAADTDQEGLCIICMELPVEIAFKPCMHAVACVRCARQIMGRQHECPMCRTPLQ